MGSIQMISKNVELIEFVFCTKTQKIF